jgi:hypothetical protein
MAANESESDAPENPVNDSIDELLDGLPAEPMLPKKRARPIDQAAPPSSQNRRADDKVIVRDETDPRERARLEAEAARRQSSTFGNSFLGASATRQKLIVGVVMMLAVLGIYAFVRTMKKNAASQNVQNTSSSAVAIATPSSPASAQVAADPPPAPTTTSAAEAVPSSTAATTTHHAHLHTTTHAAPSSSATTPIPWATSRSGS